MFEILSDKLGKVFRGLSSKGKLNEKVEAIILSMTPEERHNPSIIDGSRRRRIARGSGTEPRDINQLLNQFHQMQRLMKMGIRGKLPRNLVGIFD